MVIYLQLKDQGRFLRRKQNPGGELSVAPQTSCYLFTTSSGMLVCSVTGKQAAKPAPGTGEGKSFCDQLQLIQVQTKVNATDKYIFLCFGQLFWTGHLKRSSLAASCGNSFSFS